MNHTQATEVLNYKMLLGALARKYGKNGRLRLTPKDLEGIAPFKAHVEIQAPDLVITYKEEADNES